MDVTVFCREIVTMCEIETELLSSANTHDEAFWIEFRDSVRYMRETTQLIQDLLK